MMTSSYGKDQMMLSFAWDEKLPVDIGYPVTIEWEFVTISGTIINSWPLLDGWHQYVIKVLYGFAVDCL